MATSLDSLQSPGPVPRRPWPGGHRGQPAGARPGKLQGGSLGRGAVWGKGGGRPLLSSRSGRGTHGAQALRALPAPPPANVWAGGLPAARGWTEGSGPQGPDPSPRGPRPPQGQGGPQDDTHRGRTHHGLGGARWAPGRQRRGLDLSLGGPRCPSDLQNKTSFWQNIRRDYYHHWGPRL